MAQNKDPDTVDFRAISAIPFRARQQLLQSPSLLDVMSKELSPGQKAALFPNYYKDNATYLSGKSTGGSGSSSITPSDYKTISQTPIVSSYSSDLPKPQSTVGGNTNSQQNAAAVKNLTENSQFKGSFKEKSSYLVSRLMKDMNLTKEQAAGFVGNLAHESAGLNVDIEEQAANVHGTKGYGLAQWTDNPPGKGRRTELMKYAQANNLPVNSFETQYQFLIQELNTTENGALQKLRTASTVEEAAAAGVAFERPQGYNPKNGDMVTVAKNSHGWDSRLKYANDANSAFEEVASNIPPEQTATPVKTNKLGEVVPDEPNATPATVAAEQYAQSAAISAGSNDPAIIAAADYLQNGGGSGPIDVGSTATVQERSKGVNMEGVDQRLQVVGDAAIRAFEKANPGYKVRIISGERPGATTKSGNLSKHAQGHAVDYEIVDPDGKPLPSLGDPTHPSGMGVGPAVGDSSPKYFELMQMMEGARVHMSGKDPSYAEMGQISPGLFFKGGAWMDSMHASFGEGGSLGDVYSGFKSPEQLRAEGVDPQIIEAVNRAIAAGAPVQGSNKSMSQKDMQTFSKIVFETGITPDELQKQQVADVTPTPQDAPVGTPSSSSAVPPESQKAKVGDVVDESGTTQQNVVPAPIAQSTNPSAIPTISDGEQETASVVSPADTLTPITPEVSMAEGGVIDKKHIAIPVDGKGPTKLIGDNKAGGDAPEAIVPLEQKPEATVETIKNQTPVAPQPKVQAAEVGQQEYQQMSQSMEDLKDEVKKNSAPEINSQKEAHTVVMRSGLSAPRPTTGVNADHARLPPSARKAYADSKLEPRNNGLTTTGAVYSNHGYV